LNEYFTIISGENTELGRAELNALLSLVCDKHEISWYNRLAIIKASANPVRFILDRAALVKEAGFLIHDIRSSNDLIADLSDDMIKSLVKPSESFCIRTRSYTHQKASKYREQLVVNLGSKIRSRTGAEVSIDNPDVTLLVLLTTERIFLCKSLKSKLRELLRNRKPGKKIFFHPSMMNAQLARVMCNLAKVMPGDIVLDPFCGGGGILCEIASLGAIPVGMDLNWRLLTGANRNISCMNVSEYGLIQGDAQFCPLSKCDFIVTDPPYGRVSSTRGSNPRQLVETLFRQCQSLLKGAKRICICANTEMRIPEILNNLGLKMEIDIHVRVHRSLTREIISFGF
jgi:tRNA (guanine10-N2)-dimethyltransferase